jgi:DNA-binding CsgD family transcriptional regulator
MDKPFENYNLYFQFLETFNATGFKEIDRKDKLIQEIELMTERNDQFFFIGDMIEMKIIYTSDRSMQMLGVEPNELTPYHMNQVNHFDDLDRLGNAISNRLRVSTILKKSKEGHSILSTNFRLKLIDGLYSNILLQCFTFYSPFPNNTVHQLQIHTNVNSFKILKKNIHYYIGEDLTMLRYPDKELLKIGIPFTSREFEILQLIGNGYSSEHIAEKLFLSTHTINTHRSNIINKSGHKRIQELVAEMKVNGLL